MRTALFSAIGILLGALFATYLGLWAGAPVDEALLLGMPLGFVQAALCYAARFPARAAPLAPGSVGRVAVTHLSAAIVSTGAWLLAGFGLARLLERAAGRAGVVARFRQDAAGLALTGVLIFLLAVTSHYLVIALESARDAEMRGVRARVLAREAELRALRAQVDPHFLFNSLNSIATLTGDDPGAARRMCLLLAGFLRRSLALGQRDRITLTEELGLVTEYLAIEAIRFGRRLGVAESVEEGCRDCPVPPLLLQPLVENAVRHGIAQLVEGGTIRLEARRDPAGVTVKIDNPRDPERPAGRGEGVGLANVRGRLEAMHGEGARVDVSAAPSRYEVTLFIPWSGPVSEEAAGAGGKGSDVDAR